jgi:formylglycine-generating enzyme required for sulfatase activity
MSLTRLFHAPSEWPPVWANSWGVDEHGICASFWLEGVEFSWRWIPPGEFKMGSPGDENGRWEDEGPQHLVRISRGFWLARTPCTQQQWAAVTGGSPSHVKGDERPVESVSWEEVVRCCAELNDRWLELGSRLPTEGEWEYACRAGTESAFNDGAPCTKPAGEDAALDRLGWFGKNSGKETHPVGQKAPNAWGLHDMHGNVREWCADWGGLYRPDTEDDPVGPETCTSRVVRGGGFWLQAGSCRSACRFWLVPVDRGRARGFRFAAGQPPGSGAAASGATGRA